jgi:hypothetical protein
MGEIEEWLVNGQFKPLSGIADDEIRELMAATINLMDNTTRGLLGEVLVAHALGGRLTAPWDPWDVVLATGKKIEVKTTGLVQAWSQRKPSSPVWSIAPAAAWQASSEGYVWDPAQIRRSDWYIFAVHHGVQPGQPVEWSFRPVETLRLEGLLGQRTIGLASLDRLFNPLVLSYLDLPSWAESEGLVANKN